MRCELRGWKGVQEEGTLRRAHGGPAWGRELGALEELRDHDEAGV